MVEAFARKALWDVGLNYGHGTGHGIGNFLCVHECRYLFGTPLQSPSYERGGVFHRYGKDWDPWRGSDPGQGTQLVGSWDSTG